MKLDISIVIPACNEGQIIEKTIKTTAEYLKEKRLNFEIIVVDDGSSDNTLKILEQIQHSLPSLKIIKHEANLGKGRSVKDGVLAADGGIILFTDADLSAPLSNLDKMMDEINKGFHIVVGSRYIKGAIIKNRPVIRQILGKGFSFIIRLFKLTEVSDTQCGFKLFKKDVAKNIFTNLSIDGYAFDVEVLYISKLYGYKICECPIIWIDNTSSKMKLFRDAYRMFKDVLKIKFGNTTRHLQKK